MQVHFKKRRVKFTNLHTFGINIDEIPFMIGMYTNILNHAKKWHTAADYIAVTFPMVNIIIDMKDNVICIDSYIKYERGSTLIVGYKQFFKHLVINPYCYFRKIKIFNK